MNGLNANQAGGPRELRVPEIPLTGEHLIEASAGTGKTYTITSLVLRLLVERKLPVQSILAVTFTNAATAELRQRVFQRIVEARDYLAQGAAPTQDAVLVHIGQLPERAKVLRLLMVAADDIDSAAIYTIHGFAARMLKDHAFLSGTRPGMTLIADQRRLVEDVVVDFWSTHVATLSPTEFQQVGGLGFFAKLQELGRSVENAAEVRPVKLAPGGDKATVDAHLAQLFERVRGEFLLHGVAVRDLLVASPALSKKILQPASLHKEFELYRVYFERGLPLVGHPGTERFTQTKVRDSVKLRQVAPEHALLVHLEDLLLAWKEAEHSAVEFTNHLRARLCEAVRAKLRLEHERAGTQSFDGLLLEFCTALRDPERGTQLALAVRTLMPVALIDEFQDTDPQQYELFRRIYEPQSADLGESAPGQATAMYLIGDPKQSIYAFRGADVRTYLAAAEHARGSTWTLTTSYRASPSLVRAQNALFGGLPSPFGVEGIAYQLVSAAPDAVDQIFSSPPDDDSVRVSPAAIELVWVPDEPPVDWLEVAADEVSRFLTAGRSLGAKRVTAQDVAVLTRSNREAEQMQRFLGERGIPSILHGVKSVFESEEALELRQVLWGLVDPHNRARLRSALTTRLLGETVEELEDQGAHPEQIERWHERFRNWSELWRARGIAHAFEALSAATQLVVRTLSEKGGERRLTNYRHLGELLHEAETVEHLGAAGLLRFLDGAISDPAGQSASADARQLRLESDADAVTLTTVHRSKGLEYEVVFLPVLGKGTTRRPNNGGYRFFDTGSGENRFETRTVESRGDSAGQHLLEEQQESLRLAYVALTRAKHRIVALCGSTKSFSPLAYLLHGSSCKGAGEFGSFLAKWKLVADTASMEDVSRLCLASGGTVSVRRPSQEPLPPYIRARQDAELRAPLAPPSLSETERTSSFSAMTKGAHEQLSRDAREGRDVEDLPGSLLETGEPVHKSTDTVEILGAPVRSVLADFPRGASPGEALHALFEHSPFKEGDAQTRLGVVTRELGRRTMSEEHAVSAARSLEDVLLTPFGHSEAGVPIVLGQLARGDLSAEMEFSLPIGQAGTAFSSARLARSLGLVDRHPHAPPSEASADGFIQPFLREPYLRKVAALPFQAWSGFLRGFMDLVFVWEGRLHGVDYKSNFLGENYEDYHNDSLLASMEEHHYLLQALLYTVAIHRYGEQRIVGYQYELHFGGMHYLYLRGMHPARPSEGVFSLRPSKDLLDSLSLALGGAR